MNNFFSDNIYFDDAEDLSMTESGTVYTAEQLSRRQSRDAVASRHNHNSNVASETCIPITAMNPRPAHVEYETEDGSVALGVQELPVNLGKTVEIYNQRLNEGKPAKILGYDPYTDSLSTNALVQAASFNLVNRRDPNVIQAIAESNKYSEDVQTVAVGNQYYVHDTTKDKVLPEPEHTTYDYIQTDSEFKAAMEDTDSYLVTSDADLSTLYNGDAFEQSIPDAAPTMEQYASNADYGATVDADLNIDYDDNSSSDDQYE